MATAQQLLFNLKWRLTQLEDSLVSLQFLINQIKEEIKQMEQKNES